MDVSRDLLLFRDEAIVALALESAIAILFLYLPMRILMYVCYLTKMVIAIQLLSNLSLV